MQYRKFEAHDLLTDRQAASVRHAAQEAGELIVQHLGRPELEIHFKPDESRVTSADYASDTFLHEALRKITPNIPMLSEEGTLAEQRSAAAGGTYWCVDPLDGTNGAIAYAQGDAKSRYFGVLIQLIYEGRPVFGVAHYPLMGPHGFAQPEQPPVGGTTYFTSADGMQSFRTSGGKMPVPLQVRPLDPKRIPLASIGWNSVACDRIGGSKVTTAKLSGHRLLQLAEGQCDLALFEHDRYRPGWWDVPQAIANGAGARVVGTHDRVSSNDREGAEHVATPSMRSAYLLDYGTLEKEDQVPFHGHILGGSIEALRYVGAPLDRLDLDRHARTSAAR